MKTLNVDNYRAISMREFLDYFVNVGNVLSDEAIDTLESNKATHSDMKELGVPYMVRVPYEAVTEDDISTGRIILVNDFKGNERHKRIAPYIRPSILMEEELEKERKGKRRSYGKF